MKIKDSTKILEQLLAKEYNEKIKKIDDEAQKIRAQILKEEKQKALAQAKINHEQKIKQALLFVNQKKEEENSKTQTKISYLKKEIYDEITKGVLDKINSLPIKEKQKIIKNIYDEIKKQTDSTYEIIVWQKSNLKQKKEYEELKVTAESNTEFIEDSVFLRLQKYKEKMYNIIDKELA
ncbi:MAG: hypothetical protein ACMXX9_01835 [Candidatus Woesearchaeota archaeon]